MDDLEHMETQLSPAAKANLFGLNAARLYHITGRRGEA